MTLEDQSVGASNPSNFIGLNGAANIMNRNVNTSIMFQPTTMVNGLSSIRFLNDINNVGLPTIPHSGSLTGLNKSEILNNNEKIMNLEQANSILEKQLLAMCQENERTSMRWDLEKKEYQSKIEKQQNIIHSLTGYINSHLESEIKNREKLINNMNELRDQAFSSVQSQTMSRSSEDDTSSFKLITGSSLNRVSKPLHDRNNSNSSVDSNKGKLASNLLAQIVSQQQNIISSSNTTPLTINRKILEKHKEELRSQSLPYNFNAMGTAEMDNSSSIYVSGKEVLKDPLLVPSLKSSLKIQTTKSLDETETGHTFNLQRPLENFVQAMDIPANIADSPNSKADLNINNEEWMPESKPEASIINSPNVKMPSANIPTYQFMRCPKRVMDVWNEFTQSTPDKISVLEMNSLYGSTWRKLSPALDKQYSRRNMIYKAISFGMREKNMTIEECIHILEKARLKYYDVQSGREIEADSISSPDKSSIKIKQKSVGWLTNHINIPDELKI